MAGIQGARPWDVTLRLPSREKTGPEETGHGGKPRLITTGPNLTTMLPALLESYSNHSRSRTGGVFLVPCSGNTQSDLINSPHLISTARRICTSVYLFFVHPLITIYVDQFHFFNRIFGMSQEAEIV